MSFMYPTPSIYPPAWISQLFPDSEARPDAVISHPRDWVEAEIGRDAFELEVRRRGWHMVECNGQLVVFCTARPVNIVF